MKLRHLIGFPLLAGCLALAACSQPRGMTLGPEAAAKADDAPAQPDTPPAPAEGAPAAGAFAFPADGGGKLLAKLLPPPEPPPFSTATAGSPLPRSGLRSLEDPQSALPRFPDRTILPASLGKGLAPRPLSEGSPLDAFGDLVAAPAPPAVVAAPSLRLPARDPNRPPDLPVLAKPLPDRAPLEDPTAEYSAARAVAAPLRMRDAVAPFVPVNLPDPFEHAATVRLREPLPEDEPPPALAFMPLPPPPGPSAPDKR